MIYCRVAKLVAAQDFDSCDVNRGGPSPPSVANDSGIYQFVEPVLCAASPHPLPPNETISLSL